MENTPPSPLPKGQSSFRALLIDIAKYFVIALIITLPVKKFIAQPFVVSGTSMVPTFEDGEYLIIDEISYRLEDPVRGDVVVFRYPKDLSRYYIKRLIGLPGETVEVRDNGVFITNASGTLKIDDSFIKYGGGLTGDKRTLEDNEYYVLGDNRAGSSDSRFWGTVPRNLIIGRVFARALPFSRAELYPGDFREKASTTIR
jgi:signal peptidase I